MDREEDVDDMDDSTVDDNDDVISVLTDDNTISSSHSPPFKFKFRNSSSDLTATSNAGSISLASLNILNKAKNAFALPLSKARHVEEEADETGSVSSRGGARLGGGSSVMGSVKQILSFGDSMTSGQNITDAIHWVIPRHQSLVTIIPPDVFFSLSTFDIAFREPVINQARKNILSFSLKTITGALTISSPMIGSNHQEGGASFDQGFGQFASITGALIQIRLSVEMCQTHLYPSSTALPEAHIPTHTAAGSLVPKTESVSTTEPKQRGSGSSSIGRSSNSDIDADLDDFDAVSVSELSKYYDEPAVNTQEESSTKRSSAKHAVPPKKPPKPSLRPKESSNGSQVTVFTSLEKQHFLVLCVVLDNDIKVRASDISNGKSTLRHTFSLAHGSRGCAAAVGVRPRGL